MSDARDTEIERLQRQNDLLTLNNKNLAIDPRILAFEGRIKELETTASIAAKEYARQISQQQVRITELEAEIERLREGIETLRATDANVMRERVYALQTQLADMRSRAVAAETDRDLALAEIAILRGTLSRYDETTTEDDQPIIIHDVPPDAPR